eukprot:scaffold10909_cov172-Amphora_coffeaeformis.AAC.6
MEDALMTRASVALPKLRQASTTSNSRMRFKHGYFWIVVPAAKKGTNARECASKSASVGLRQRRNT